MSTYMNYPGFIPPTMVTGGSTGSPMVLTPVVTVPAPVADWPVFTTIMTPNTVQVLANNPTIDGANGTARTG